MRDLGGWSAWPLTLAFRRLSFHDASISSDLKGRLSLGTSCLWDTSCKRRPATFLSGAVGVLLGVRS